MDSLLLPIAEIRHLRDDESSDSLDALKRLACSRDESLGPI